MNIKDWAIENGPEDKMIWKNSFWDQIIFLRDTIPGIFAKSYEDDKQLCEAVIVISTHTSKSIKLPVVKFTTLNGIEFIMRHNFHDWKISIQSPFPILRNFGNLFDPEKEIHHCYCEGFEKEWVLKPYNEGQMNFTVELYSPKYYPFTFLWIIANQ